MRKLIRAKFTIYAGVIVDINIPENILELPSTGEVIKNAKRNLVSELENHVKKLQRIDASNVVFEELNVPDLDKVNV